MVRTVLAALLVCAVGVVQAAAQTCTGNVQITKSARVSVGGSAGFADGSRGLAAEATFGGTVWFINGAVEHQKFTTVEEGNLDHAMPIRIGGGGQIGSGRVAFCPVASYESVDLTDLYLSAFGGTPNPGLKFSARQRVIRGGGHVGFKMWQRGSFELVPTAGVLFTQGHFRLTTNDDEETDTAKWAEFIIGAGAVLGKRVSITPSFQFRADSDAFDYTIFRVVATVGFGSR